MIFLCCYCSFSLYPYVVVAFFFSLFKSQAILKYGGSTDEILLKCIVFHMRETSYYIICLNGSNQINVDFQV